MDGGHVPDRDARLQPGDRCRAVVRRISYRRRRHAGRLVHGVDRLPRQDPEVVGDADGGMQVGSLTAFIAYLAQILMSLMMATMVLAMVPRASVSAKRIFEVLQTSSSVTPPADPVRPALVRGEVQFENVTFAYPGAE